MRGVASASWNDVASREFAFLATLGIGLEESFSHWEGDYVRFSGIAGGLSIAYEPESTGDLTGYVWRGGDRQLTMTFPELAWRHASGEALPSSRPRNGREAEEATCAWARIMRFAVPEYLRSTSQAAG